MLSPTIKPKTVTWVACFPFYTNAGVHALGELTESSLCGELALGFQSRESLAIKHCMGQTRAQSTRNSWAAWSV